MFRIIEGIFKITGATGRIAEVDNQNRLLVSLDAPATPVNITRVQHTQFSEINEDSSVDTYYTITNAKTLKIEYLRGSSEDNETNSCISLYYDSDGTGNNLELLAVGFTSGTSFEYNINREFVGDGIKRILLRRERLDEGDRQIFGQFAGYEE